MNITFDLHNHRIRYSVAASILFHILILWTFGFFQVKNVHTDKLINDIEFIEPPKPNAAPGPVEEKPKNIWDFMKMALPQIKKPDFPEPKKEDKPVEVIKKEAEKVLEVEKKLVDKEDQLKRKVDPLAFKDLEKKRDNALKDLEKLTKNDPERLKDLLEQEKHIVDKGELARTTADPLQFDDIGKKKVENVKDIIAAEKGKQERIKDLTPADLLTEKKEPLKKNQVAGDDLGIKLKSRETPDKPFKEIKATPEERKAARELLALQEQVKLVDKAPTVASAGGKGGGGGKPRIGYGGGGSINVDKKTDELKKVETASVIGKDAKKSAASEATAVAAPSKSAVEIAGPLSDRDRISSPLPKAPEWLEQKGTGADVAIRFTVSPAGNVRDSMTVEITSGYTELDKLVMQALKQWQFAPLKKSEAQEDQWGVVTVHFRIK